MIRGLFLAAVLAASSVFLPQQGPNAATHQTVASSALAMFDTDFVAQRHCPRDEVVWLNIPSGIYHEKGMRWYGRTEYGAYVCRKEAAAPGNRDTRNGQ